VICGPEITDRIKRIWGLDEEGESRGAWRDCGVDNLWYMMGELQDYVYVIRWGFIFKQAIWQ
jgi:hypothetical protein